MNLSVVVPTLNAREELADCLDALAEYAPDAEVIVVNGPSADGTTGMVQDRSDVDVLVEIADRTINAARNAGIDRSTGDYVAFVNHTLAVTEDWPAALDRGLAGNAVVTGPTRSQIAGNALEEPEERAIAGRTVAYFNPGNVAFDREPLDKLDGFDEYLSVGGARDFAHRLAGSDYSVCWDDRMAVREEVGSDGGEPSTDWNWKYRSLAYRLVKNYGLRPTVVRRVLAHAGSDAYHHLKAVVTGEEPPSQWLGTGRDVVTGILGGVWTGLGARRRDRTARRNPSGRSSRADRAVTVYDWR
ncbi:MAG: glycosyltransferase family A protein [Halovenus sp.]